MPRAGYPGLFRQHGFVSNGPRRAATKSPALRGLLPTGLHNDVVPRYHRGTKNFKKDDFFQRYRHGTDELHDTGVTCTTNEESS